MKANHFRIFLHALRSALVILGGFIAYEILLELEKIWNKEYPNKQHNYIKAKLYKLIIIFLIDLFILYTFLFTFKVEL
jgi:hypothetical protein